MGQETFNLDSLVAEIVENVQAATTTHAIVIEGKTDAHIMGDRDRIGQGFMNLLTNAVKYSPQADKVAVHLFREQKQAMVSVQDFGLVLTKPIIRKSLSASTKSAVQKYAPTQDWVWGYISQRKSWIGMGAASPSRAARVRGPPLQ